MSVILESQSDDPLICIEEFHGCPDGTPFALDRSRRFRIGERVAYRSFRQNPNLVDNPAGWMVIFEAADGNLYAATQTYFVTEDCWQGLKKFFAKRLMHEPKRRSPANP